jgi:hypothetical protein
MDAVQTMANVATERHAAREKSVAQGAAQQNVIAVQAAPMLALGGLAQPCPQPSPRFL